MVSCLETNTYGSILTGIAVRCGGPAGYGVSRAGTRAVRAVDTRHLQASVRPGVARLPARDSVAPHHRQEEPDRWSLPDAGSHRAALHGRVHLPDHGYYKAVPGQERT